LRITGPCSIDCETTGVKKVDTSDPRRAEHVCTAVAPHGLVTFEKPTIERGAKVTAHNLPYDAVILGQWDCEWDDTKVLGHLAGRPDTSLKGMQVALLGRPALHYEEAAERGELPAYCLYDAQNTWDLRPVLYNALPPQTQILYNTLEKPLLPLWSKMTMERSFRLDKGPLLAYRTALSGVVDGLLAQVQGMLPRGREIARCKKCELAQLVMEKGQRCEDGKHHSWQTAFDEDWPTNINSPEQVAAALESLGIHGLRSTDADTLRLVRDRHPAIPLLLEYKGRHKELSTYIEPWAELAEAGQLLGAVWRPTGAWTGRVSSAYPNLQNVPKTLERFFLAPEQGDELLTFDNAQLEVRIAAHISQDPALLDACRSSDIHAEMMELFGFEDRRAAKVGLFGTMYLGGPAVVLDQARKFGVEMTWLEAEAMQAVIYQRLPDYFCWARGLAEERVIEGLFGRIHHIPLGGDDHMAREVVNSPIQGGAGDVPKYQMLALWRAGYKVVRQVHDSVTVAVPASASAEAKKDIPAIMERAAPPLDVPIKVELQPDPRARARAYNEQ